MRRKFITVFKWKTSRTDGWLMEGRILTEEDEGMLWWFQHTPLLLLVIAHMKSVCRLSESESLCENIYSTCVTVLSSLLTQVTHSKKYDLWIFECHWILPVKVNPGFLECKGFIRQDAMTLRLKQSPNRKMKKKSDKSLFKLRRLSKTLAQFAWIL